MEITNHPSWIKLLTKLHDEKGVDFTQYKDSTLQRRVVSRLKSCKVLSITEYCNYIETHPDEINELLDSITINVTEYFRNPESFKAIDKYVVPRVLLAKQEKRHKIIRVWSCGCSSGDEPYSIAILLSEKLESYLDKFAITIVGTDIDRRIIKQAREMVYSKDRLKAVDSKLLEKYFEDLGDSKYQLKDRVKKMVRFQYLDIVKDKPLLHCDVVLCRNLLIYFNKSLQEDILLKLYESLNPGGFLVLGMVESLVGSANDRFETVDNRLRIYRRPDVASAENGAIMSQDDIDNLVKDMLEK